MLTPEYLSWITDRAEEVASSLFSRILNKIIERIFARFKRQDDYVLTSVDKHNIDTLQEAGYLLDDIQQEIVEATGIEAKVIKEAFEDAGIEGMEIDDEVYDQVGIDVPDLTESPAAVRAMQRNYEATMGEWKNLTGTTAIDADNKFIEACDEAFTNVNSGAMGLDQAIKEAIDKLVEEGITAVHYASGRTDSIDVAIARAVRTGIAQAAAQVTLTRMKEMEVDLLITSAHLGARPSHEAWQGQIFHVDWSTIDIYRRYTKDDSVPAPNTASKYPDFVQSTRFGFVDGLCGANCRHSFSPYFEGMPNPYADFDNKKSREVYKLEQKQRAMERAIRKTKREKAAYKTAMENAPASFRDFYKEEYDKKTELLKRQQLQYNSYCEENNLRPLEKRLESHGMMQYKNIAEMPLKSAGDPIKDIYGAAEDSHPKEVEAYIKELNEKGVEIIRGESESLGYSPSLVPGKPGQIHVSKGCSIGAWVHEMKHFRDDEEMGYPGFSVLCQNRQLAYKMERDAYALEIEMAKKANRMDVVKQLRKNRKERRNEIYGRQNSRKNK